MSRMPSVMSHNFSQVPSASIPRSSFSRDFGYKTTFDAGWLVPVYIDEVLPGDSFNVQLNAFARMSTPLYPIMDNLFFDTFFFFVPNRLVWDNWQKMMGEQRNPGDSTDYLVPQMVSPAGTGYLNESLQDYLGLPTAVPGLSHSALFTRAYNLIYNEWFRDENLQNSVTVDVGDGPDLPANYVLLRRGKRHDYFTSALPWPQKGPAVTIPLTGNAPVSGLGFTSTPVAFANGTVMRQTGSLANETSAGSNWIPTSSSGTIGARAAGSASGTVKPDIFADLTNVSAATINALRQAFQIQKLFERDARGGTRYTEIIRAHFGVVSPDARLQRPEYLGGGSTPININPIAQTSANASQPTPLGNLAAMGTLHARGHGFAKSFVEHGIIIGLASVRADLNYQQGLDRMWSRRARFDFYWPALSHIGEQAILNKEIYAQGTANPTQDAAVFGYQERWAEYRYKPSKITGQFRSNFAQTLDGWHLAQNFASLPALNAAFIVENPPMARITAVPSYPDFLLDCFIRQRTARPMPTYSVPGLIDHF